MTKHSFEIEFPTPAAHTGKVIMDGVELRGVTAVRLIGEVGETVELAVTFIPEKVIARIAEPNVVALVKQLIAETTDLGSTDKTYVRADPQ